MKKMFTGFSPFKWAPLKQYALTLTFLAGCSSFAMAQAPVNDDCNNAIDISGGGLFINQTNLDATTGLPEMDCDAQPATADMWYKVHSGSTTGDITVTVDAGFGFVLLCKQYFDGSCGAFTSLGCAFGDLVITPTPNTTYYFRVFEINNSQVDFSIQASGNISVPLPVTMSKLSGEVADRKTLLSWNTFMEQNNNGFDIERSSDSRNFQKIGFVPTQSPNGNSSGKLAYTFTDITSLNGTAYYRLVQKDRDGKTTYSNIVKISNNKGQEVQISMYPNPANNRLNIGLNAPSNNNAMLTLTDVTGKVVWSSFARENNYSIDLTPFTSGIYLLRYTGDGNTTVQKFIKE
jgi:hypothetical protein